MPTIALIMNNSNKSFRFFDFSAGNLEGDLQRLVVSWQERWGRSLPTKILLWCARLDSNKHWFYPTSTSSLRVYQFRHGRIKKRFSQTQNRKDRKSLEVKTFCILNESRCVATPKIPQIVWNSQLKQVNNQIYVSAHKLCGVLWQRPKGATIVRYATYYVHLRTPIIQQIGITPIQFCESHLRGWLLLSRPSVIMGFDTKPI